MTNDEVQEIIDRAEDEHDRLKDRLHEQYDEIERLKEEYMILQNASDEVEEELQQRIDKAIEYIEEQSKFIEGATYTEFVIKKCY